MSQLTDQLDFNGRARCRWRMRGQVQGVGFRPAVYRWAVAQRLVGRVYNDAHGVVIEAEGPPDRLTAFETGLIPCLPRLARVDTTVREQIDPTGDRVFEISGSEVSAPADAMVTVDTAVCRSCFEEMHDPADVATGTS